MSSGAKPLACCRARSSSAVASRIASLVFAVAVVAPRNPRRILAMTLDSWVRLMVLTDDALLKGRDAVDVCRRAVAGGATLIQVRSKTRPPFEVAGLPPAPVAALPGPRPVNHPVAVALPPRPAGR